jgi:putative transposase
VSISCMFIFYGVQSTDSVLKGDMQTRCRDLLRQCCDSMDIRILKGVVSKDHIHLHLSYPPKHSISDIVKRLKGQEREVDAG